MSSLSCANRQTILSANIKERKNLIKDLISIAKPINKLAGRRGFEPPVHGKADNTLAGCRFQPLSHLPTATNNCKRDFNEMFLGNQVQEKRESASCSKVP
jgi:hypothetical protein